jgi:ankyrin repeat protein
MFSNPKHTSSSNQEKEPTKQLQGSQKKYLGITVPHGPHSPQQKWTNEYPDNQLKMQEELLKAIQDRDVGTVDRLLSNLDTSVFKGIMQMPTQRNSRKVLFKTKILHIAARRGDPASVSRLLEKLKALPLKDKTAVLDAQDSGGKSALHIAIEEGHVDAANRLIQNHAKIYIEDAMGQTPLHVAVIRNCEDIALSLLEYKVQKDTIGPPSSDPAPPETDFKEVHRLLIMQDRTGKTALHHASMMRKPQLVILIVAATASAERIFLNEFLNKEDKKNRSAIFHAAQKGRSLIVWLLAQELRESGTGLSTLVGEDDKTLLHWAVEGRHQSTVDALLASVAIESKASASGVPSEASKSKHISKTTQPNAPPSQPLVASYVNKKSKEGLTALDLAINQIDPDDLTDNTIRTLLDHGADPASEGHDRLTSLQRAYFSNNQKVIKEMQRPAKTLAEAETSETMLRKTIAEFINEHEKAVSELNNQTSSLLHQEALASQKRNAERVQKVLEAPSTTVSELTDTKQKNAGGAPPESKMK